MPYEIAVENIKCGGCANTIRTQLEKMESINSCEVDVEKGLINIDGDDVYRTDATTLLLKLGYPETGTAEGIKAAAAKAKSFVSCAIGKITS
jgi:copper chaperone